MVSVAVFIEYQKLMRKLQNGGKPENVKYKRDPVIRKDYGLVELSREDLKRHPERSFVGVYHIPSLRYLGSNPDELIDSSNFEAEQLESRLSREMWLKKKLSLKRQDKQTAYTIVERAEKVQPDGALLIENKVVVHSIDKWFI